MTNKCQSRPKDGERCAADAQTGKDVCVFHDPAKATEVRRARRAGGRRRSQRTAVLPSQMPDHPLRNTIEVSELLAASINQVRRGELDPRVANSLGYLAGVLLRSLEQGPLEERIARVEASLGIGANAQRPTTMEESDDEKSTKAN